MPNYPVYQPINMVKYPDPKTMVIDWAGAINRGVKEGIDLGVKIKDSRIKSMVAAQNIAQSQAAVIEAKRAGDLDKMRTDSRLQLDQLAQEELERQATIKKSALWLRKEEAESKQQTLQAETSNESSYILNEITAELLASPEAIEYKNLINRLPGANPIEQLEIRNEAIKYLEDEDGPVARIGGLTDRYYALNPEVKAKGGLDMNHSIPNRFQLDNILSSSQIDTGRPTFKKTINEYGEETTEQVPEILTPNQYLAKLSWDIDLAQKEVEKASPDTRAKLIEYLKKNMSPENMTKTGIKELQAYGAVPAAPATKPQAPDVLSGKKVVVNGIEMNRPTGILGNIPKWWNSVKVMEALRLQSPNGEGHKISNDPKVNAQDIEYWVNTLKALEDTQQTQNAGEKASTQFLINNVKKQLSARRTAMGIKQPEEEDVAANVTKGKALDDFPDEASARKAGKIKGDLVTINGHKARLN